MASLAAIVTECSLDDDTAAVRVRGLDEQVGGCSMQNVGHRARTHASLAEGIDESKLSVTLRLENPGVTPGEKRKQLKR